MATQKEDKPEAAPGPSRVRQIGLGLALLLAGAGGGAGASYALGLGGGGEGVAAAEGHGEAGDEPAVEDHGGGHGEAPAEGGHGAAPAEGGHGAPAAEDHGAPAGGHGGGEAAPAHSGPAVTSLGTFVVNLRGSGGGRVLRVEVQVEADARSTREVTARKAMLRDAVITLASDYSYSDLEGVEGKTHLRDELLGRLNGAIGGKGSVDRVYFTEFVVQ